MKLLSGRAGCGKVGDREKTGRENINVHYAQGMTPLSFLPIDDYANEITGVHVTITTGEGRPGDITVTRLPCTFPGLSPGAIVLKHAIIILPQLDKYSTS